MKQSEIDVINVLEQSFERDDLDMYVIDIQDYMADNTDQLEIDNPNMDDFLQEVIPEFTDEYRIGTERQWLSQLRDIINHAKTLATK